jgi:GTPase
MRFIDEVRVVVSGGNGGAGAKSWRREKFVPRGGPDGGDGGNGGAVLFVAEPGLNTLIDFSFSPQIRAENGTAGEANCRHGRDGTDTICKVPVGTQVYDGDSLTADLSAIGACWIAARGGRGGKGNTFFKSATNQAPDYAQPGCAGEIRELRLVLKSVADVGLVGLPNVGKSTLVSAVSKAHPKIADYPFTTLRPSLGVVLVADGKRFVIADIPGLVPGAHLGKGLGLRFLQHIERTSVLAQLIDISTELHGLKDDEAAAKDEDLVRMAMAQFDALDEELRLFSESLATKPRIVIFSKADLPQSKQAYILTKPIFAGRGIESLLLSSHTGEGLENFKHGLSMMVQAQKA